MELTMSKVCVLWLCAWQAFTQYMLTRGKKVYYTLVDFKSG